jgi:phage shock protein C
MLAGVCEGLARYFDVNPALYRVGFVVLTLLGGAGILIYLAAVLVIPEEGKQDSIASGALRSRQDQPWALVGLGLVAVAYGLRAMPPGCSHSSQAV